MAVSHPDPIYSPAPDVTLSQPFAASDHTSAVSWAAVFAGAAAAAALGLILLILGTGLGMTAVSPWANEGISATAFGVTTIVWLTLSQLLASGMGGYLAGRLRTKWADAARDEVFFRDTAHGFLSWAVATLVTAALLTSAVGSIVGAGVQAGASVVGGAASSAVMPAGGALAGRDDAPGSSGRRGSGAIDYFVDTLFREPSEPSAPATSGAVTDPVPSPGSPDSSSSSADSALPTADANAPAAASATRSPRALPPGRSAAQDSAEVARIFMNADLAQPLPPEDLRYVAQIVAQRTGMTQQEAQQRVSQNYAQMQTRLQEAETQARATADEARKATAYSALWLFLSLLIGAFVASFAATFGGRQRDA